MKREQRNQYCSQCGKRLITFGIRADMVMIMIPPDGSRRQLDNAYNPITGEENYADVWECPDYKRRWIFTNDHDLVVRYEDELHWGAILK